MQQLQHSPIGVVSNVLTEATLEFNSPIHPSSVSSASFIFSRPTTALAITFPPQNTPGGYRIEAGPEFQDFLGQTMSQVYTGVFSISLPVISGTVTHTIAPSLSNWVSIPFTRSYKNVQNNVTNQNYVMVPTLSPSLSFARTDTNISFAWYGLSNVAYQTFSSTNLIDWHPFGPAILGTNGLLDVFVPVEGEFLRFFRVTAE